MNELMKLMMQNKNFRENYRRPDGSKLDEYRIQMYQENPNQSQDQDDDPLTPEEMEAAMGMMGIPPELIYEDENDEEE